MKYSEGGRIISKKAHACGGNEWDIIRIGADLKLKCAKCGRIVFVSVDEADRMAKKYLSDKVEND